MIEAAKYWILDPEGEIDPIKLLGWIALGVFWVLLMLQSGVF